MSGNKRFLYILSMGIAVTIAISVVLYWATFIPMALYFSNFQAQVHLSPSGLLSQQEEPGRPTGRSSGLTATSYFMPELGLDKEMRRWELSRYANLRDDLFDYGEGKGEGGVSVIGYSRFNRKYGLIEDGSGYEVTKDNKAWYVKKRTDYIGPKGSSDRPEANLGKFYDLIGCHFYQKDENGRYVSGLLVYDKVLRRFFRIKYKIENTSPYTVTTLVQENNEMGALFEPIQMGTIQKNSRQLQLSWTPALRKGDPNKIYERRRSSGTKFEYEDPNDLYPAYAEAGLRIGAWNGEVPVLEKSGALSIFDVNTMTIKSVGYQAQSQYEASPCASLAFISQPFVRNENYSGLVTASLARDGIGLWMTAFDPNGKPVRVTAPNEYSVRARQGKESEGEATVYHKLMVGCRYAAESLSPPVFGLASFFAAPHIEAGAGYRAMFLLPNSVMGTQGLVFAFDPKAGIIFGLLTLAPSILVGLLLAWRIRIDARMLGIGSKERLWWTVGAIAFGLSAYITYRLTRPKVTLATCANCGKLRRPDMDLCHKCGAGWHVPEIMPPLWRVVEETKIEK